VQQSGTAPDFFNNAASIAVVLLFTKVVSHRSRKAPRETQRAKALTAFHIIAVLSATIAVAASLVATDWQSAPDAVCAALRGVAWVGLGFAGVILIVDVIADAIADGGRRSGEHPTDLVPDVNRPGTTPSGP
jgi:hypothetical protein